MAVGITKGCIHTKGQKLLKGFSCKTIIQFKSMTNYHCYKMFKYVVLEIKE